MLHIFIVLKLPTYENNELLLKKVYCHLIYVIKYFFFIFSNSFLEIENNTRFFVLFFYFWKIELKKTRKIRFRALCSHFHFEKK